MDVLTHARGGRGTRPGAERERASVVHCLLLQVHCLSRVRTGLVGL